MRAQHGVEIKNTLSHSNGDMGSRETRVSFSRDATSSLRQNRQADFTFTGEARKVENHCSLLFSRGGKDLKSETVIFTTTFFRGNV